MATPDMLWEEIEAAERDMGRRGIDKIVSENPWKLQLILTGRLIKEFGNLRQELVKVNGNSNSKRDRVRRVAINISVPAVTGAGAYAMILELVRSLAGG